MLDTKTLEDDCRNCRVFGWILAAIATAIVIWILASMGLPIWLLVILALVVAVALIYFCNGYCQRRMEAAASAAAKEAAAEAAARQAAAERVAADERAARKAAEAAEVERMRAEAERKAANERTAREAAEAAEAERRRAVSEAREAAERASAERRAARAADEAAEAERLRAEAEAREAAERASAQQFTAAAMSPDPAPYTAEADHMGRGGDGASDATIEGTRPAALTGPRGGMADDLKKIKGIGAKLELLCNQLGFYHFDQIAAWSDSEVAWVDANLKGFKGRVTREKWVAQATILAADR